MLTGRQFIPEQKGNKKGDIDKTSFAMDNLITVNNREPCVSLSSEALFRLSRSRDAFAFALSMSTSPYVIIPLFSYWIISHYSPTRLQAIEWTAISVFFTTTVPFVVVVLGVITGRITDLHVMMREERRIPFLVAIVSSFAGTAILYYMGVPKEIVILGMMVVANGIAFAMLSAFTKVSIHIAVLTVGIFATAMLVSVHLFWAFLGLPLVIWGRIYRKRHSVWEGVSAVPVACVVTWGVITIFDLLPR